MSGDGLAALPAYSSLDKIAFIHIQVTATLSMARLWCDQGKPAADHRTIKAAARRTPPTAASSGNCQKEGPEG